MPSSTTRRARRDACCHCERQARVVYRNRGYCWPCVRTLTAGRAQPTPPKTPPPDLANQIRTTSPTKAAALAFIDRAIAGLERATPRCIAHRRWAEQSRTRYQRVRTLIARGN